MTFTAKEVLQAEKLIRKFEDDARSWRWARWAIVLVSATGVIY